ncbi:MAG TPA: 50S ribosomal protein L25 [Tepidisphaeraceae bacterium]|jgi:large subunit ribosomal protein L25|nr:50S ribosomal protein L25 [Tepidisphaeraceae bacterium]
MAQTITVTAQARSALGSRANKRLRDTGFIPGVIYGHKQAVVPVTLPRKELSTHLNRGAHLFSLAVGQMSETVLVKEVQYDHLGLEVLHVDFARVDLNERVTVTVPLELKGTPKGEAEGGVLQQIMSEMEVECLVTDIPDIIRHNVSDLGLNSVLHVKELTLPPNVKPTADEDQIVATVREIVEEAAAPAEGETAEPEVIGRKPEEGEAAEAEKK